MKLAQEILNKVHSIPEGMRRWIAFFCFAIMAVVLLRMWSSAVSNRLSSVNGGQTISASVREKDLLSGDLPPEDLKVLGPLGGIFESLKSFDELVKDYIYKIPLPEKTFASAFFSQATSKITDVLEGGWNYINDGFDQIKKQVSKIKI